MLKKCLYCGTDFETSNVNRLFCTPYCAVVSNNEQIEIKKKRNLQGRKCSFCKKEFKPTNQKHIYCSVNCRKKSYWKRRNRI